MIRILFMSILIFIVAGCGMNNASDDYENRYENLDPTRNQSEVERNDLDRQLGFVRYTKDDFNAQAEQEDYVLNREKMADTITRSMMQNEGFEEVATLVTGEEVLIAYQKNDSIDKERADEIARKSAMSITPRYFKIYVSDQASLMQDIQSLHKSRTTNHNYQNTIDNIIKEMDKGNKRD